MTEVVPCYQTRLSLMSRLKPWPTLPPIQRSGVSEARPGASGSSTCGLVGDGVHGIQDQADAFEHAFEAGDFALQVAQAGGGDLIGADAAVGGGEAPLGLDQLGLEQPLESWVERALLDLEQVVGALLDVLDERIAVGRLAAKRFEDHHFERAGEEIAWSWSFHRLFYDRPRVNRS